MAFTVGTQWGTITLWDAAADGNLGKTRFTARSNVEKELCKKRLTNSWTKVNAQDAQGRTALHEACRYGHLEVVKFLLEKGADTSITTTEGSTVLHLAAFNGHNEVVKYLVESAKMNVNSQDKSLDTPLMSATGGGKASTAKLLLELGADASLVNRNKKTAEDLAASAEVSKVFTANKTPSLTKY